MLTVGMQVRVLSPFDQAFPATYTVADVRVAEDNQTIVYLDGIDTAFAPDYLEQA
jgi:hypothetical protein